MPINSTAAAAAAAASLVLCKQALAYYLQSDVCIKDVAHSELYVPLQSAVALLESATSEAVLFVS